MRILASALIASVLASGGSDQTASHRPAPMVFRLRSSGVVSHDLTQINHGFTVADRSALFPGALFTRAEAQCSATLVGPDALLTARHCVSLAADTGVPLQIEYGGQVAEAVCESAPARDAALCRFTPAITGIRLDAIARRPVTVNDAVILTGWAEPRAGQMHRLTRAIRRALGFAGPFRVGSGTVQSAGSLISVTGAMTPAGPVVADPGDSGGAAYYRSTPHAIVGVNVCGGPGCADGATDGTTTLANLTDPGAVAWICDWMARTKATVCGYSTDPVNCAGGPSPPPAL